MSCATRSARPGSRSSARSRATATAACAAKPEFWRDFLERVRRRLDGGALSERAFARLAEHFRKPGVLGRLSRRRADARALAARGTGARDRLQLGFAAAAPARAARPRRRSSRPFRSRRSRRRASPDAEIFLRTCARLVDRACARRSTSGDSPAGRLRGGARRRPLRRSCSTGAAAIRTWPSGSGACRRSAARPGAALISCRRKFA